MFVTIYGRMSCPYCTKAIELAQSLKAKDASVDFEFIDMPKLSLSKEDVAAKIGTVVNTVPQVLIDNKPIGGCSEFQEYIKANNL